MKTLYLRCTGRGLHPYAKVGAIYRAELMPGGYYYMLLEVETGGGQIKVPKHKVDGRISFTELTDLELLTTLCEHPEDPDED